MLSNLLHAKLCLLLLVPLLRYQIGNSLACVAVAWLLVASFVELKHLWLGRLNVARSQIRFLHVAEFLIIRCLFLLFLISLTRAAFWCVLASVCEAQLRLCKFCLEFVSAQS